MVGCEDLWPSCFHNSPHLSTRQYSRSLQGRVTTIGLEPSAVGMHSMRRTKAAQICKKTATTLAGPVHSTLGQFSGNGPTAKEFARSVAAQRAGDGGVGGIEPVRVLLSEHDLRPLRADRYVAVAIVIGTIWSMPNLHPLVTASGLVRGVLAP